MCPVSLPERRSLSVECLFVFCFVLFCYLIGKLVFYFRIIQFYKTFMKTESSHILIASFPY